MIDILLHLGVDAKFLDDLQVLWMLVVSNTSRFIHPVFLDICPELPHLFIHVIQEVEVMEFGQP